MLVAGGSSARFLDEARIAFAPVDRDEPVSAHHRHPLLAVAEVA
jgi:hypothetical protein